MMEQMTFTGDPFVDLGALVAEILPEKTIEDKIRFVTDVYVDKWKGNLHSIFLHSKITHISLKNKPELQRTRVLEYYLGVLEGKGHVSEGYCRVCANNALLFEAGRNNYPLVGSGDFVNFHHSHEFGLLICKDCLVKLYFIPLGILQAGGNLMALQVQNEYMARLLREDIIQNNLDKIHRGSSEGILKSSFTNPRNALFYFAGKLIRRFDLFDQPPQQIRLFYFTNFGSKPNVEIHDLPNPVFSFLQRVLKPDLRPHWLNLVKRYYHFRKPIYFDENAQEWVETKKKMTTKLNISDYRGSNRNTIHDRLLSGRSILGPLRQIYKVEKFPILIATTYLKEVRKVRQEQIDLIQMISDRIIALSRKVGDYKKFITPIEGAKYGHQLRGALLRMVKAHYKNGEPEPFVRLKDYVDYLFPDWQSWYEVRDFLLICLYEKLHDLRVEPSQISDETIHEIQDAANHSIESFNQ